MSTLLILRGPPASGKSTYAATLEGYTVVNRDSIRFTMYGKYWGVDEDVVTQVEDAMIDAALYAGQDVVVDATNLRNRNLRTKLSLGSRYGARVTFVDFPTTLDDAIQRDRQRERNVGESVIRSMFARYKIDPRTGALRAAPTPLPYFAPYKQDTTKPLAYIVDTDGTVASSEGVRGPYDTTKYHLDTVRRHVATLVAGLSVLGAVSIVALSGRDAAYREVTEKWWRECGLHFDAFYMRPEGDTRMDAIVKYELFKERVEPHYNVLAAIDDRPQVIRMWRTIGLDVIDVGAGREF